MRRGNTDQEPGECGVMWGLSNEEMKGTRRNQAKTSQEVTEQKAKKLKQCFWSCLPPTIFFAILGGWPTSTLATEATSMS